MTDTMHVEGQHDTAGAMQGAVDHTLDSGVDSTAINPLALLPGNTSEARIAHLFRGVRRQGRIHPLQHLIQRYRAAAREADAGAAGTPATP